MEVTLKPRPDAPRSAILQRRQKSAANLTNLQGGRLIAASSVRLYGVAPARGRGFWKEPPCPFLVT